MGKTVLALDLAATCGFAFGDVGGVPKCGAVRFGRPPRPSRDDPGSCNDDIWAEAIKWLIDMTKTVQPDVVAIEAAIPFIAMDGCTNFKSMERLHGLQAVMRAVVCLRGPLVAKLVHVQSARKLFIGKGNLPREQAKYAVMKKCVDIGWLTDENVTDDKADACCVWAKACADIDPEIALQFSPLFAKAAAE